MENDQEKFRLRAFKDLDSYGKRFIKSLSLCDIQNDEAFSDLWFSWPSLANVVARSNNLAAISKLKNWSGYGQTCKRGMPQSNCVKENLNDWVAIIGQSFIGKSSVGKQLNVAFGLRVYDTDEIIEQRLGCSISDCFSAWGESAFREMEGRVLMDIFENDKGIIILGGGSLQGIVTRRLMELVNYRILLDADLEEIWRRLTSSKYEANDFSADFHALVSAEKHFFNSVWKLRQPLFEQVATVKLFCGGLNSLRLASEIHKLLQAQQLLTA